MYSRDKIKIKNGFIHLTIYKHYFKPLNVPNERKVLHTVLNYRVCTLYKLNRIYSMDENSMTT